MPENQHEQVPEEAVLLAAKAAYVEVGPTQLEDQRAALQAAAAVLCAQERERREEAERRVRWLVDRLDRLDRFADQLDARGRANRDATDLRNILEDARLYLDHPETDVGVAARAAQQERERVKGALLSDEAKDALYDADRRYQNVDPREQSEDGWATALLEAASDAALTTLDKETD